MIDELRPISTDRLFRSSKTVPIGPRTVVVRGLSTYDTRCRYEEALLASLDVRRELKDPASRRYRLSIAATLEAADDDQLRSLLVLAARNKAEIEAADEIKPEFAAKPDEATVDEERDVLERRAAAITAAADLRKKYVENKAANRQAEVAPWDHDQLVAVYVRTAADIAIDNAFGEAYSASGLLYGIRQEDGTPYFQTLDEVRALNDDARLLLSTELRLVNDIDPLAWSGPSSTATPPVPGS